MKSTKLEKGINNLRGLGANKKCPGFYGGIPSRDITIGEGNGMDTYCRVILSFVISPTRALHHHF